MNNANEQLSLGPSCGQIEMNDFGPTKIWKIYYLTRNRRMIIQDLIVFDEPGPSLRKLDMQI